MSEGDILDGQEFHELCMDYRGATPGNAQAAYARIQNFINHHFAAKPSPTESAGERSGTPLVDANAMDVREHESYGGSTVETTLNPNGEFVTADFARTLERDLTAARQRIEVLEERVAIEAANGAHWAATYRRWVGNDTVQALIAANDRAESAESRLAAVEANSQRYEYLRGLDEGIEFRDGEGTYRADGPNGTELDSIIDSAIRQLKEKS